MRTKPTKSLCIFLTFILSFIIIFNVSGCTQVMPDELDDPVIKEQLLNFDFSYSSANTRPLTDLWIGYDNEEEGYVPGYYPEYYGECNTYLTDYQEYNPEYYLVYLKKEYIPQCIDYMHEYLSTDDKDWYESNFTEYDDTGDIDGKYLMAFLTLNPQPYEHLKFCVADSIEDIPFYYDNQYQLVFCSQSRPAVIKENLTTGEVLNKEITLYRRVILKYDFWKNKAEQRGEFAEICHSLNISDLSGEVIESFPIEYEEMTHTNYPYRGNKDGYDAVSVCALVVNEPSGRYLLLPRAFKGIDYVIENCFSLWKNPPESGDPLVEIRDIYRGYHVYFATAFIEEYDAEDKNGLLYDIRGIYGYCDEFGMYDYELILNKVIRKV